MFRNKAYLCLNINYMTLSDLSEIKKEETKKLIIERTGSDKPNPQGLCCPRCKAKEVYANPEAPDDIKRWAWIIRAFKVDDFSHCLNCDEWF